MRRQRQGGKGKENEERFGDGGVVVRESGRESWDEALSRQTVQFHWM